MALLEDATLEAVVDETRRQDSVQMESVEAKRIKCEEDRGLMESEIPNNNSMHSLRSVLY